MTKLTTLAFLFVLAATYAACSGANSAGGPSEAAPASACSGLSERAAAPVLRAVDKHSYCTRAEDCAAVELHTSCFDLCSRPIRAEATPKIKEALAAADANECKAFAANGCRHVAPPCAPPLAPTCRAGVCSF